MLTISPGYWSPPTAGSAGGVDPTQSNTSLTVYKCLSVDACVGGSVSDAQLVIPSVCADGYVGELCGGCDSGWANTGGGKCVRCHSGGALIFSLIVFPAIVLAVLAVLVAIVVHNPRQKSQVLLTASYDSSASMLFASDSETTILCAGDGSNAQLDVGQARAPVCEPSTAV